MPLTKYICSECKHQILVNHLEGAGEITTPCSNCKQKIVVKTNEEGRIVEFREIPPPKEEKKPDPPPTFKQKFLKALPKIVIVLLLYRILIPKPVRELVWYMIGYLLTGLFWGLMSMLLWILERIVSK